MIATGFSLPFQFRYSALGAMAGQPLAIRVRVAQPDPDGLVALTLRLFGQMALSGALGGGSVAPWDCTLALSVLPGRDPGESVFRAQPCRLADEAWVVLCHLLLRLHQRLPIRSVDVLAPGDASPRVLVTDAAESTFPGVYGRLPFALEDRKPEGGGYSFYLRLESPLAPDSELRLNQALEVWVRAVLLGAYAMAPGDPARCYVEPDGKGVVSYGHVIEWAVFKLQADPVAALAGLVNLLACFHARCQPLSMVEIG
ncbi:hypothetical protein [Variovorax sp. OV329]|uniref:hypothetical protein n=1 Tax=Variovorax sp. OV329 TaxID=1882825 RepID=UPI0008E4C444|nr:hypothetical protein [Variovorax sp. OV329]SFM81048.1 hypothetical protein SAMN05444747_10935 [Variovorax sp. OV329]